MISSLEIFIIFNLQEAIKCQNDEKIPWWCVMFMNWIILHMIKSISQCWNKKFKNIIIPIFPLFIHVFFIKGSMLIRLLCNENDADFE